MFTIWVFFSFIVKYFAYLLSIDQPAAPSESLEARYIIIPSHISALPLKTVQLAASFVSSASTFPMSFNSSCSPFLACLPFFFSTSRVFVKKTRGILLGIYLSDISKLETRESLLESLLLSPFLFRRFRFPSRRPSYFVQLIISVLGIFVSMFGSLSEETIKKSPLTAARYFRLCREFEKKILFRWNERKK